VDTETPVVLKARLAASDDRTPSATHRSTFSSSHFVEHDVMGSGDMWPDSADELRARQERELAAGFALASMEHALAREAFHVGVALRQAGVELDARTFVALRILEVCVDQLIEPSDAFTELVENGSLDRSVSLATELLDRDAA
jgi:hypothetical protein